MFHDCLKHMILMTSLEMKAEFLLLQYMHKNIIFESCHENLFTLLQLAIGINL